MKQPAAGPDVCNCLAVRRAARLTSQIYDRHLRPVGLTSAQFSILAMLWHQPRLRMAELAEAMLMERTTLLRALQPMQRDGLLVAVAAPDSPRAPRLELLEAGRSKLAAAAPHWRAAQAEFEGRFSPQKAALMRELLGELTA